MTDKHQFRVTYLDAEDNQITEIQEIDKDGKYHWSKQVKGTRRFKNAGDKEWQ